MKLSYRLLAVVGAAALIATSATAITIDLVKRSEKPAGAENNITPEEFDYNMSTIESAFLDVGTLGEQDANAVVITGGTIAGITDLAIADGGTGAGDATAARGNLGLAIGSNVQAWDAALDALAGEISGADKLFYFDGADSGAITDFSAQARTFVAATTQAAQRTALGLGTIATQPADNVAITGGAISGITDLGILDGGTGASDAPTALANLGGQASDPTLTAVAGATTAADTMIYFSAVDTAAVTTVTPFIRTLLDDADQAAAQATLGVTGGSDPELDCIAALTSEANKGIYYTGSGTCALFDLSAAGRALVDDADNTAQRMTLGLGSLATASTIDDSNWSGTDLSVANGGTGVSTLTGLVKGNGSSAFSAAAAGTDYYAPGSTDVAVADGGTGASDATAARTNLGISNRVLAQNLRCVPSKTLGATPNTLEGTSTPIEHSFQYWTFDPDTDWFMDCLTYFPSWSNVGNVGLRIRFCYTVNVNTGNFLFGGAVRALTNEDLDTTAETYSYQYTAATAVPGTAGILNCASIAFSSAQIDGATTGPVNIRLTRDADNASDTTTGALRVMEQTILIEEQ